MCFIVPLCITIAPKASRCNDVVVKVLNNVIHMSWRLNTIQIITTHGQHNAKRSTTRSENDVTLTEQVKALLTQQTPHIRNEQAKSTGIEQADFPFEIVTHIRIPCAIHQRCRFVLYGKYDEIRIILCVPLCHVLEYHTQLPRYCSTLYNSGKVYQIQ